jgi:hypothetical protein
VKREWWRILVVGAAAMAAVLPLPAGVVDRWFGRAMYPATQRVLTKVSNGVPFALFDPLLVCAAAFVVWGVTSVWRSPRGNRRRLAFRRVWEGLAAAAIVYLGFLGLWGMNYQRPPITERVDFSRSRITREAVRALNVTALVELTRSRAGLPERLADWPSRDRVAAELRPGLAPAAAALGLSPGVVAGRPKLTMLDPYFVRAGVSGMTDPFFLETLVASNLLAFETPQVIAHEWGHLAGLARESEASFFAWIVCVNGTPEARYSAWLETFALTVGAFEGEERRARLDALPAAARADLRAAAERTRRDEVQPLRLFAWTTYDRYLKANRVDSGTRNYGEVVQLLVGTRFGPGWRPVLRGAR